MEDYTEETEKAVSFMSVKLNFGKIVKITDEQKFH